ncbi:MAG TPA: serine hydrolase domain-containing protein, partial [Gemmatimonadaceae bacterium]|nr:serine hydrolase domain-containing protein [Gemmatimonadaceae bacterium]
MLALILPVAARAQAVDSAAAVDRVFARYATADGPGCAVGVARDGRTLIERAYGMANLEYDVANTPATVFETGSVAKQFTAAALVLLALDGRLSLDDPARKYLPELPDYGVPVTVRQMLNHTSGLRDWGSVAAAAGWPRGTRVHTHAHVLDIVSRQRSLNFPPGSEHDYSNTGYNLGAVIVERVSGEPFAEFTRRRIFEPLGMRHTGWRDDFTRTVKGRSTAYSPRGGDSGGFRLDMPFENVHGQGGLLTTVGDLLRWNEHLARPSEAVGGRALVDSMERQGRLTSGRRIEYALGLYVRSHGGRREVSHSGSTAGYRAFLARYPEQRLSVALLCNRGDANPTALARRVADASLPAAPALHPAFAGMDAESRPAPAEL